MTIKKSDYSVANQNLINLWISTDIPNRIAAYQLSINDPNSGLLAQQAVLQDIEDIYFQTYTSFQTVMVSGFHEERRWLVGDYYQSIVTEPLIQSIADNPGNTLLFPIGYTDLDPLQVPDLTGIPDDSLADSEKEGLLEEEDELTPPPLIPSGAVLLAAREKQRDALNAQIAALTVLQNELDVGDSGQANLAFALASANTALTRVLNLIANPSFYSTPDRLLQIDDRLNGGSSYLGEAVIGVDQRAAQIALDDDPHVANRYFWLTQRLNLAFGSLIRLKGNQKAITLLQDRIAQLQAEVAFYLSIGFP